MSHTYTCHRGHKWTLGIVPACGDTSSCPVCGLEATQIDGRSIAAETGRTYDSPLAVLEATDVSGASGISGGASIATSEGGEITARVELKIYDEPFRGQITIPDGPLQRGELLPVFQGMAEVIVDVAVRAVVAQGKAVQCKKGCGACCRQLVPVSDLEARRLSEVVAEMPEPRRELVLSRFAAAREKLDRAGLLSKLADSQSIPGESLTALGLDYFGQRIPCPFLEEESCSIYEDRPVICREYLVTTPAENCARPTRESVHPVPLPAKVAGAVFRGDPASRNKTARWIPLTLALDWARTHPDQDPPRPGKELLQEFFEELSRRPSGR